MISMLKFALDQQNSVKNKPLDLKSINGIKNLIIREIFEFKSIGSVN